MRIEVLDTTLRDGSQGEGVHLSLGDKFAIAETLCELGIPLIEAGNPASNPKDAAFFAEAAQCPGLFGRLVAFGSTRKRERTADEDPGLSALIAAGTPTVTLFGKCWDFQVRAVLGAEPEENLAMIADSVARLKAAGRRVIFDAEHFFDGWKADPGYALACLKTAAQAGADLCCLCDTNGGSFPEEIAAGVRAARKALPDLPLGVHCHNDMGMAEACSLAGLEAGAVQVQGTFLGFGERCGNCNLSALIPSLQLKKGWELIPPEGLRAWTPAARRVADILNFSLPSSLPYVGRSAFAHKGGMHADAVLKDPATFEQVSPEAVGNSRRFLISEVSGRGMLAEKIGRFFPELTKDNRQTARILARLKELEQEGYQFESAEAGLVLAVMRALKEYAPCFELVRYQTVNEQPAVEGVPSSALVKIRVNGQTRLCCGEGNGPVNALDKALREALTAFYPSVKEMSLTDYKVRVLTPQAATAAVVRVLITSTDGRSEWSTVGVSSHVIDASFKDLSDSIEYKILILDKQGDCTKQSPR